MDGVISRSKREDIALQFKEFSHSQSSRVSNSQPFCIINIELSNSLLKVERTYPTLLDIIGDFGGIV